MPIPPAPLGNRAPVKGAQDSGMNTRDDQRPDYDPAFPDWVF